MRKQGYGVMLALTIVLTLAGLSTLVPQASASKACVLGYLAHCSFTPWSTLICFALAGMSCKIRKKRFTG